MFKQLDFTNAGGLYVYQETLDWLQTSYSQLLDGLGAAFGNYLILNGVNIVAGVASSGWVVINGEILPFVGGNVATYCYVESVKTNEQYDDGTQKPAYTIKRVKFTAVPGAGSFAFSNLQPLPYQAATIQDCLSDIQTLVNGLINIEPAVILSGCIVSAVNTGTSKLTISAGMVLIDGVIVNAPSYDNSTYPCYLTSAGTYTTVMPGAGDFITFDPYTSSYYLDVMFRNQHRSGEVVMQTDPATLSSFDTGTGLGKWRWKGWKLCDKLRSLVPVGYDRRSANPNDGIYDPAYTTPGNTVGTTNKIMLTGSNIPELQGDAFTEKNGSDGTANARPIYNGDGEGNGSEWITGKIRVNHGVTQTGVDVRQPGYVVLFIEKI